LNPGQWVVGTADDIARDLVAWARAVLPEAVINSKPLSLRERDAGVDIRLVGLAPRPAPRTTNPPITIDLDFVVTVQLADAFAEQRALGELLLAASDRSEFEIVAGRSAAEICVALGIPVAAGFVLRTPLTRTREAKTAPLVRFPLKVDTAELSVVEGIVTGPGAIPIFGAVVTVTDIGRQGRTDAHGRFRIAGAPRDENGIKLNVKARGVELDATAMPGQSVVLRLPLEV
jgi:hypothetical protein